MNRSIYSFVYLNEIKKIPMKIVKLNLVLVMSLVVTTISYGQTKMVGGAEMYPTKNIVENAVNSKDHTTLIAAVKAGELLETLSSEGPFTVFAPVNNAFAALPEGTVETLLKPENKPQLQAVLTYHVIPGKLKASDVVDAIKKGEGKAEVATVNGGILTFMLDGDAVKIKDAAGNVATVTIADVHQSNGVIHVIDTVLLP